MGAVEAKTPQENTDNLIPQEVDIAGEKAVACIINGLPVDLHASDV